MIDRLLAPLSDDDRLTDPILLRPVELPCQLRRDPTSLRRTAAQSIVVPEEISSRLAALAQNAGATTSTAVLAAFEVLLFRLCGQPELVVGTPGAIATAVHLQIDGELSFADVLARTHQSVTGSDVRDAAKGHGRRPWSGPIAAAAASRANVLFLADSAEPLSIECAEFDLALSYAGERSGLRCSLLSATNCFDSATIERWLQSFARLVNEFVNAPNAPIAKLSMIAAAERERLLAQWNSEPSGSVGDVPLCAAFERHVNRDPDAIAVAGDTVQWSYGELNARANQLARALQERGVGAGSVVGFAFERSICTVLTMLAIAKAGAAYLPLDASYPFERLRCMFADAGAKILITATAVAKRLNGLAAADCWIDFDALDLAAYASGDLASACDPDHLAYVMYTSGTTGRPKGVLVTQRGITNLVTASSALAIDRSDVVAQLANVSFDAATYEIWGALLNGARLVIAGRETMLVPNALAAWLREHRISVAFVTSALLRHICHEAPAAFATLRLLIAGGDIVDTDTARKIRAHGAPRRFLNGYGPTESTTFATTFEIAEVSDAGIPIGRPLTNVQAYILDAEINLVPIGVRGDLYIGGHGLARGYVNDPESTARQFIRHPFSADPKARLYATGDIARFRSDGNIEFLGRRDRQVKIRGFRIEIDEIQAALLALPNVTEAVVTIREDEPGDKRIVAYLVDEALPQRDPAHFRSLLSRRLPEYMLPSAVISVAAIPLNTNGKIDTAALLDSQTRIAATTAAEQLPQSPAECVVASIIGELLGAPVATRDANFFALGGHSLLAMRAIVRIRERLGVELSLREFFGAPTVAAIACRVSAAATSIEAPIVALERRGTEPSAAARPISLSAAQRRLWLLGELEPGAVTYNVPYAFRLRGRLERAALERALQEVVHRHDVLRSTVCVIDGEPAYVIDPQFRLNVPLVDVASEAALDAVLLREREGSFDLKTDVPIRALLVRRAADEHVLLVTLHHIATDGWSMGVFKRELGLFYAADVNAQALPPHTAAVTYADFAQREREQFGSTEFAERFAYWAALLKDAPPPLELGHRQPGGAPSSTPGRLRSRTLAHSTRDALRHYCREHGCTEFSTLFAAFAVLLHRETGRRDFVIGTVLANRTYSAFDALIGFFVNTLALRVRIAGDPTFSAFLEQTHRSMLAAFDRQDMPFEKLVEIARPVRIATRTPLLNVMFVLQNAPDDPLALTGLDVTPVPLERTTAKFDLTLEVTTGPSGEVILGAEYRTDLFDAPAVDALLETLETLVCGAVGDADLPLSRYSMRKTPRLAHGLDRDTPSHQALRIAPEEKIKRVSENIVESETHLALRGVWERVLDIGPIGIHDNFFDLGGHSILAVRLIGEIEKAFHLRLPLSLLFDKPTIDGVVQALAAGMVCSGADTIVTYNPDGNLRPMFFLHGSIGGAGFYCRALADRLGPNRPFHVLKPQSSDTDRLPPSIEAIAAENIMLIKRLSPRGPYLLGGYCAGGLVAFEMARQLRAAGARIASVVLIDVPDAPRTMRGITECVDRAGALLGVAPRHRQRLTGALARLPHLLARFAASSTKVRFVTRRLGRLVTGAGSDEIDTVPSGLALRAWFRLTESYVPRRYGGRIALLFTHTGGASPACERRGWSSISASVQRQSIAGTHLTCIGEYLNETAAAFAQTLVNEP